MANLVACHWLELKVKITSSLIRDNLPEISRLAIQSEQHANAKIREAAVKLLGVLRSEGVDPVVSAASAGVKNLHSAPVQAMATESNLPLSGKSNSDNWVAFEKVAVEESGPMAVRIIQKIRADHPESSPRSFKLKINEVFGTESAAVIFANYRGN